MSTCDAGRKTGTPMSTSRPPLIFRITRPSTTSSSLVVSTMRCQLIMRSARRLDSCTSPPSPSRASSRTVILSPTLGSSSSNSSLAMIALALEADLDHGVPADEADDLAVDELAWRQILDLLAEQLLHVAFGDLGAEGVGQELLGLGVIEIQGSDQIFVNHVSPRASHRGSPVCRIVALSARAGTQACRGPLGAAWVHVLPPLAQCEKAWDPAKVIG